MVSKKLQNKFYAALESLKDGKNDYILEALAAGAKATFEGMLTGEVSEDGTYIPSKDEVPRSASIGPDSCPRVLTKEDIQMLTHDPDTENEEDPEELNFDGNEAKRFPAYPGQFSEEEDPFYSMVAEAVTKLGNTISEMKTANNAPLIEAIKEGFKCCFEAVAGQPMTMRVEHTVDNLPDKSGEFKKQEVVYVQVNDHITVRITNDYCEYLEDGHIENTMGFPDVESQPTGMTVEHKIDSVADKIGDLKEQEVVYVQVNDHITVRVTHDYCEYLEDGHIENGMGFPDDEIHTTPEQAMETAQQEKILNNF